MSADSFSHLDTKGNATMVAISHKPPMHRVATAEGTLICQPNTISALKKQAIPKGDALVVAKIAAIQAAKKTAETIPLCHPLPLSRVDLDFEILSNQIRIISTVETIAPTGVEMEALTAVSAAALTLYDMCKAIDKTMQITNIALRSKTKHAVETSS